MIDRFRPTAAIAVVLTLLIGGCTAVDGASSGGASSGGAAQSEDAADLVDRIRAEPFGDDAVAAVDEVLASASVLVAEEWDAEAEAVVRVTPWQRQNLAVEAANGGGMTGAELQALVPVPEGSPPVGFLLSAWALEYDSAGARFAREYLGEQDFTRADRVPFPSLITTLFLADATRGVSAVDATASPSDHSVNTVSLVSAPCTAVANFVQQGIATVANALKVSTAGGGFFGFLGKIWNRAVELAAGLVGGLIDLVTRPVVNVLVTVFGAIETVRQLTTFIMPWRAKAVTVPETLAFGVDGAVVEGDVTVTVEDSRLPIPEAVLDCSAAFGVDLRNAGSAAGSAVEWSIRNEGRPDLAAAVESDPVLDERQTASLTFRTGQETSEAVATGAQHAGLALVRASIRRNDIERVRGLLVHLLLDQIPTAIRGLVESFAAPVLNAATESLTALSDVHASDYVVVEYHGPPRDDGEPIGCGPNDIVPGRYVGEDVPFEDWLERIDVTVADDGTIGGSWYTRYSGDGYALGPFVEEYTSTLGGTVEFPRALLTDWRRNSEPQPIDDEARRLASTPKAVAVTSMVGDCTSLEWLYLDGEGTFRLFITATPAD